MIRVTYQKKNGELVERYVTVYSPYSIGDTNGFGWKVVNKEYSYKNKYYSSFEHDKLLMKFYKRDKFIREFKKTFKKSVKLAEYTLLAILIIKEISSRV